MLELLKQPWPWYVAGILIGLTVPTLLIIGNKSFGISSSLRHICAACIPGNVTFFKYIWKKESWNLFFVGVIAIGGIIASFLLTNPNAMVFAESTKHALEAGNVKDYSHLMPTDLFSWDSLFTLRGFIFMVVGGFMVGFGTRYAGANNPVYYLAQNELHQLNANKFPVGAFLDEKIQLFTSQKINLQKGNLIYLFSDGYADQFGGQHRKKLKYKTFKEFLLEIQHLPMQEQQQILATRLTNWKGNLEQVDDVLVIGIKL